MLFINEQSRQIVHKFSSKLPSKSLYTIMLGSGGMPVSHINSFFFLSFCLISMIFQRLDIICQDEQMRRSAAHLSYSFMEVFVSVDARLLRFEYIMQIVIHLIILSIYGLEWL